MSRSRRVFHHHFGLFAFPFLFIRASRSRVFSCVLVCSRGRVCFVLTYAFPSAFGLASTRIDTWIHDRSKSVFIPCLQHSRSFFGFTSKSKESKNERQKERHAARVAVFHFEHAKCRWKQGCRGEHPKTTGKRIRFRHNDKRSGITNKMTFGIRRGRSRMAAVAPHPPRKFLCSTLSTTPTWSQAEVSPVSTNKHALLEFLGQDDRHDINNKEHAPAATQRQQDAKKEQLP